MKISDASDVYAFGMLVWEVVSPWVRIVHPRAHGSRSQANPHRGRRMEQFCLLGCPDLTTLTSWTKCET